MMLAEQDLAALWLTLKLASLTTCILLIIGIPIAWWLARTQWRYKVILEAIIALPLVLPPTVLGFYILLMLGPNGPFSSILSWLNMPSLAFRFEALVIASVFYSLPFAIQPLQNAFTTISQRHLEVAATLGASPWDLFFHVVLPLARPGLITAMVLSFAHTLGEFGVVLMIGGNIPGKTQVLSIAIYEHVEAIEYAQAHTLSALLLVLSFTLLVIVYVINRRFVMVKL